MYHTPSNHLEWWSPSIHMGRWPSGTSFRLTIELSNTGDISEVVALFLGATPLPGFDQVRGMAAGYCPPFDNLLPFLRDLLIEAASTSGPVARDSVIDL